MKKLFTMFAIAAILFAAGCQKYDDTPMKNRIDELEELCKQMDTNIASLQTLVNALQNNDHITSVTPITQNGETVGYTITFSKSAPITIYHGGNGQNGDYIFKSVTQDDDYVYFTLADGSVITVGKTEPHSNADIIKFVDSKVKLICVLNWDTDKDGELSYEEAKAVKTIGCKFEGSSIVSFEEFQYFTGVTSLQYETFYDCYSLTKIILPDGLKTIGDQAFGNCYNLTEISLPDGITSIGWWAFGACLSLTNVYCKSVTPPTLEDEAFDEIPSSVKIYVPSASVSAYKSAENWSVYTSMIVGYDF